MPVVAHQVTYVDEFAHRLVHADCSSIIFIFEIMTFIKSWEDFERAAEKLYLSNPMKVTGIKKTLYFLSSCLWSGKLKFTVIFWLIIINLFL